ncbi:hypothetical protein MMA231_00965 [Asticcacaulis sp. MM231]|uniref:LamG-like jellyroll fold domain-containing protein n=1 Tax=Asticcacaulis sp. MM231 TaxID=3157666 RepID=UPI0032D5789F
MSTRILTTSGLSADPNGGVYLPSAAERAAYTALFTAPATGGRGLWFDASVAANYANSGPGDDPAGFKAYERTGFDSAAVPARLLTPDPVRQHHPIYIPADEVTGKPCWLFGAGGSGANALSNINNGALTFASQIQSSQEVNDTPILLPTNGWSVAFKARVPAPGGTVNGVAFAAYPTGIPGGAVLGSKTLGTDGFSVEIDQANGHLIAYNRRDYTLYRNNTDLRDGNWHDYVLAWDFGTHSMSAYIDGVSIANATTPYPNDISGATGCDKMVIGGLGGTAGGPDIRFGGLVSFLAFLPNQSLGNVTYRNLVRAVMAEK